MAEISIGQLDSSDVGVYSGFLRKCNFASGDADVFNWYSSLEGTVMLIARDGHKVVGSSISDNLDGTGWLGSIGVDEGYRRRGIGRELTETSVAILEKQGCDTILLRASQIGKELYSSIGFRETYLYQNFIMPKNHFGQGHPSVANLRIMGKITEDHLAMDREISGENRKKALRTVPPGLGYEIVEDGALKAYITPTVGNGFLGLAHDPEAIPALIAEMSAHRDFKVRTLVGSAGNDFMRKSGLKHLDGALRMAIGKDPLKKIRNIVGTISSSIG